MIRSIVILVLMILVNVAVVFAIIRLVKRTDENMQKFFLDKSSSFLPVQEEQLPGETDDVNEKVEIIEKVEPKYMLNDISDANYKSSNFKEQYKNVKEEMNFNKSDIILDVMNSNDDEDSKLNNAFKSICEGFDFDTIYELSTVGIDKQLEVLQSVFNEKQKVVLANYLSSVGGETFNISDFYSYVREQAKLIDENYYVKTGSKEETFDDLGENVVTVHDDGIVEGIKVVHKNKLYDYSI